MHNFNLEEHFSFNLSDNLDICLIQLQNKQNKTENSNIVLDRSFELIVRNIIIQLIYKKKSIFFCLFVWMYIFGKKIPGRLFPNIARLFNFAGK